MLLELLSSSGHIIKVAPVMIEGNMNMSELFLLQQLSSYAAMATQSNVSSGTTTLKNVVWRCTSQWTWRSWGRSLLMTSNLMALMF